MMVEPGLDLLLPHVDSKYTLVSVSSKRARKIMMRDVGSLDNPVTCALQEIADGKVEWERFEGDLDEIPVEEADAAAEEGETPEEEASEAEAGEDATETPEAEEAEDAEATEEVDG